MLLRSVLPVAVALLAVQTNQEWPLIANPAIDITSVTLEYDFEATNMSVGFTGDRFKSLIETKIKGMGIKIVDRKTASEDQPFMILTLVVTRLDNRNVVVMGTINVCERVLIPRTQKSSYLPVAAHDAQTVLSSPSERDIIEAIDSQALHLLNLFEKLDRKKI